MVFAALEEDVEVFVEGGAGGVDEDEGFFREFGLFGFGQLMG